MTGKGDRVADLNEKYTLASVEKLEKPDSGSHYQIEFPNDLEVLVIKGGEFSDLKKGKKSYKDNLRVPEQTPSSKPNQPFWYLFAAGNVIILGWVYLNWRSHK